MKLTTHLHLVLKLRMCGAIPPFFPVPSWCEQGLYTKDADVEEQMESCQVTFYSKKFNDRVV